MNKLLISFIIPYFNAGETIQETIDSIFNQSYSNFDIWLINDGSTDQFSIDKLKDFEGNEKIHILQQENTGPSIAKNHGVSKSKGELLCFLDADNIILENYLVDAVYIFKSKIEIDVVYSDFSYFGDSSGIHISNQIDYFNIFIGNSIDNCVIIKKKSFLSVGGFDPFLSKLGLEDWELWITLLKNGYKFHYLKTVHFCYRVHKKSRTNTTANLNIEIIKKYIYNKHSDYLALIYLQTFYKYKMHNESIDNKIGKLIMYPYRFLMRKL